MRGWARWKQVTVGCGGLLVAGFACMMFFFFRDQAAFEKLPADVRTATVAARQTARAPKPTETSRPTDLAPMDEPSETPEPADTNEPTATDEPTATVRPTVTTEPTATAAPTDEPAPTPDVQGAYDELRSVIEAMHKATKVTVFSNLKVSTNPLRCTFVVTDLWYEYRDFEKERLVDSVAELCSAATAKHGLRGPVPKPGQDWNDSAMTSFVDAGDKEVARNSIFGTKIIR